MSEFIGEIENGIRHALKTVKRVAVKPRPNGMCGPWYQASLDCGIRMAACPDTAYATEVAQPCDQWADPDGTMHVVQWEML